MHTNVDIENWPRKTAYEFFGEFEDPFFNFSANVDVTNLYRFCKQNSLSFSLTSLYCSQVTANNIREFRMRLVDNVLVEFDQIHATQTILNDDETFSFAYFAMEDDVFEFNRSGRDAIEKYKALKSFDVESDRVDLIYYSVIPWVSFTSFKHPSRLDSSRTIPRIVFGKMFDEGSRKLMPLSIEANHRIMDGFHVGKFFQDFQKTADSL
jgi:chloramphenicol O-acetyltransferase type A